LAIVAGAVPVTIILALAVSDLSSHEPQRYFEARSLSSKLMLTPISATATRYDQQILPDPFGSDDIFIIKGYRLEPESDSAIESFYEARLTGDGWHVDSLEDDPVGQRLPGAPNLHMVFTKPGHYGDSLSYVVEYETDSHHLLLTLDSHI
jgi:hypothetical protein